MAENKQYLSQKLDQGVLLINEDVLATIVINAVKDVEGVAGLSSKPALDIAEKIGKKQAGKSLKISFGPEGELSVDCNIVIVYGQSVVNTANAVQSAIASALESSANAVVSAVNVNVCGIVRQ